ncbi:hypothetical protein [Wuhan Millipede virus 4]|uniref:hypothetical protein n=1 Tax=Wuhan Millipede virus 4 TaxID=1923689 RepID=UPI00090B7577|nr:hypothetical protein [Wuhan Millipede virus 4]APG78207.1 hypothetical protein [Wuhan Millipede virus 4]
MELNEYYSKIESFSKDEMDSHLRTNYREESQEWPDYLDYVEEWQWHFKEKMSQTRKDFIYTYLSKRRVRIQCDDHTHTFSDSPIGGENVVHFPSPDAYVNPSACWYKRLLAAEDELSSDDNPTGPARLTIPEATVLKRLTGIRLVRENNTPELLDFSTFKRMWWSNPTYEKAVQLLEASKLPPLKHSTPSVPASDVTEIIMGAREDLPLAPANWIGKHANGPDVIMFDPNSIEAQHGLHLLLLGRRDWEAIINTINRIRQTVREDSVLTSDGIFRHMDRFCRHCDFFKDKNAARARRDDPGWETAVNQHLRPSPVGVYYSPPGNGKTTAMDRGLFIGIDTDWLIHSSDFNTVVAPFLNMGLPVLTNQYDLATNSGEKFFGTFNPNHLRTDEFGRVYTSLEEIEAAKKLFGDDLHIVQTNQYFSHTLPMLFRAQYVYNRTRELMLDKKPPKRLFTTELNQPTSYEELLDQLRTNSVARAETKLRKKRKKSRQRRKRKPLSSFDS